MNWPAIIAGGLVILASGASGALVLLRRGRGMRSAEQKFGLHTPHLNRMAAVLGVITGLVMGGIVVYFLALNATGNIIEWIGRFSYVLVAGASGVHLLALVYAFLSLRREERAFGAKDGPPAGSLAKLRVEALLHFRREHKHYSDLKMRDEAAVDQYIDFLGNPLLHVRRDLARVPFYGYMGTVCGILLMAQELGQITEATETFSVLSSMAGGLVLAFQTTLVALLAYLPLRKLTDHLIQRVETLESFCHGLRDHQHGR